MTATGKAARWPIYI
jgi:hypothetical protein